MRPLILVMALVGAAVLALSDPAVGGIIQTGCDTLATDPPTVRFTFAVANDCVVDIGSIRIQKDAACGAGSDSCCVLECSAPPNWNCIVVHTGGALWTTPQVSSIRVGQRLDGFSIVTRVHACCYPYYFIDSGPGDPWCDNNICFVLDLAVPTRASSWGALKAIYR